MPLDPEVLNQLLLTFKSELNERLQTITNDLLKLEKGNINDAERDEIILNIFRAAHNIKGTSGSLEINDINAIAHHIESIFTSIQKKLVVINPELIDLCFEAVDKIKIIFDYFSEKKPLPFAVDDLIKRLEQAQTATPTGKKKIRHKAGEQKQATRELNTSFSDETNYSIRVPISNIDRISVLMEEIQTNKIAMDNHYEELIKLTRKVKEFTHIWQQILLFFKNYMNKNSGDGLQKIYITGSDHYTEIANSVMHMQKDMHGRINNLDLLFNSLQEETRTLRLIPASNFLSTLPRYVRDLCKELDKKVELKITGDEVKVDKIVLEGLKDPIIHLLRNSIDHGIESSAERKNNDKSEMGHINIDLSEEGSQIIIRISDDGRGIDIQKVAELAVRKNIINKSELQNLSDKDTAELMFRPGFSTKEIITNVSGRGIGLNIVKNNIENLNGHISFTTELNKGTSFELRTPLTLASERGFVVSAGGQLFVVPTHSVERVVLLPESSIIDVEGGQAVMLDNHPIQLQALIDILMLEQKEFPKPKQLSILFIKHDIHLIAILVDEIIGEKEIVIKPFQPPLSKVACIAGGTLSNNNQVIMVLDPRDLINTALQVTKTTRLNLQEKKLIEESIMPHILVVDDSITTRALEKNILESKNYKVTTAVNGKEAWDLLQKQTFSLIITDVVMPIMDGFTLTEQVKKSEKLNHLPVIIVTSLGSDAEKKRGIDAGADAYIIKSDFESGVLLEIVEQLV